MRRSLRSRRGGVSPCRISLFPLVLLCCGVPLCRAAVTRAASESLHSLSRDARPAVATAATAVPLSPRGGTARAYPRTASGRRAESARNATAGTAVPPGQGRHAAALSGTVRDALGRPAPGATVELVSEHGETALHAKSDARGHYHFAAIPPGAYWLTARLRGFAPRRVVLRFRGGAAYTYTVTLALAPVEQSVVVTATGAPEPGAQVGETVSTITAAQLRRQRPLTVSDLLAQRPGVQVVRDGAVGGLTSLFIRGGASQFTTVLLDGMPIQRPDLGYFDYATLLPAGIQQVQILRGPDSVVYGSDAISGVVALTSASGADNPGPELRADVGYGSFATTQNSASLAGSDGSLDYAANFAYLGTHNQIPNNHFLDRTYAGNFGWAMDANNILRFTIHYAGSSAGNPNAFAFYGIPDGAYDREGETYDTVSWHQWTSPHWENDWMFGQAAINYGYFDPAPAGTLVNGNYVGNVVTITGANGYSATGQAILDYGGIYPMDFASDTQRWFAQWRSIWHMAPGWEVIGGYRYTQDRAIAPAPISLHDNGGYAELRGGLWNRLFASGGVSVDRETPFGATVNPQGSLAYFPRLSRGGWLDETRLRVSAGTALKDPTLSQEQSSLYALALALGGTAQARAIGVSPLGPQRGRDFDAGVDQFLWGDHMRLSATVFDNRYYNMIEFVPSSAYALLGLGGRALGPAPYGADFNSLTESAKGVELEYRLRALGFLSRLSYTYSDARVLSSLSTDALFPSINPNFPGIPIGAYAPLVGGRPFAAAPESGSFEFGYVPGPWAIIGGVVAASRRDASTFLSDANFGNTMLLPNHDLAPGYHLFNLSGYIHLSPALTLHGAMDNAFNEATEQVFGYPALGRSLRIGLSVDVLAWRHAF
jgi:vitamin B12 transporter